MVGREGCDFSFSGLKTALRLAVEKRGGALSAADQADLAASLQESIVASLADRTRRAIALFRERYPTGKTLVVAGGVAANTALRQRLTDLAARAGLDFVAPPLSLCTDNGAMIAWAGLERLKRGPGRCARFRAAAALAARSESRAGARRRREGVSAMQRFGVIGGGAWGTALAQVLRRAGRDVVIWAREPEVVAAINTDHDNPLFLPGVALDPAIRATRDLADAARADALLLVVPAQHLRAMCKQLGPSLAPSTPLIICAKGIEEESGALLSEAVAATLPQAPCAVLSGPTFAAEVAKGLPTAITLAAGDADVGPASHQCDRHA